MDDTSRGTPKSRVKAGYWNNIENRRSFLLNLAKEEGFDPMVRANWRGKTTKLRSGEVLISEQRQNYLIISLKGTSLLSRYGGFIETLLEDTFPETFRNDGGNHAQIFLLHHLLTYNVCLSCGRILGRSKEQEGIPMQHC